MKQGLWGGLMCFFSVFAFSAVPCSNAVSTDNVNFCTSFKAVAKCYCTSSGIPGPMCEDMPMLYARMVSIYGSLDKACEAQKYTTKQDCLDNWNCYRTGGVDSQGRLCSSNQQACH